MVPHGWALCRAAIQTSRKVNRAVGRCATLWFQSSGRFAWHGATWLDAAIQTSRKVNRAVGRCATLWFQSSGRFAWHGATWLDAAPRCDSNLPEDCH